MALPRTPFSSDPGYEQTSNFFDKFYPQGPHRDPSPSVRVKPEAVDIARAHTIGSVGLLFETMAQPPQSKSRYKREDPKNFTKMNMRKIREIQSQSKRKQEEKSKPLKPVQMLDKYSHVPAKVTAHINGPRPPSGGRPSSAGAVRWGPVTHHNGGDSRVPVNGTGVGDSNTGLRERRPSSVNSERSKNFLAANVSSARTTSIKRPPSRQKLESLEAKKQQDLHEYQRGQVPQYLRARQEEWRRAEEERVASLPDPTVPPGHTLMPAKERLKTLQALREHQSTLTAELNALPLQSVTLRVKQRKTALESKLGEIEDALKIFSRPRVFVRTDE